MRFDVVFADTCLGGSTVAARVAASGTGLRAYFLADYAINPLGVKARDDVHAVLERWVRMATACSGTLVVACNTASVLLAQSPDVLAMAESAGLRVLSMVDLLDRVLAEHSRTVLGKRVCLMGTRFTVSQTIYRDRLMGAGAVEVIPLAATRTEAMIAHLRHETAEGRAAILDEIGEIVRRADVVVLGCTLFPLIAPLVREVTPRCALLDPAAGIDGLFTSANPAPHTLTLALTGSAMALDEVRVQASTLFPGWKVEEIVLGGST
jgi:glutamate racemase